MKRAYDSSIRPPAPVADVLLVHPVTGVSHSCKGKLDSGADTTVIPQRLVSILGLTPKGQLWAKGFDGTYSKRPLYYLGLTIEGTSLTAVRCIAADRADILVGRNVLNRFFITLDGKRLEFEMLPV